MAQGGNTRFGQPGGNKQFVGNSKPWSIRSAMRYLVRNAAELDVPFDTLTELDIVKLLLTGIEKPVIAQLIGARKVAKAVQGKDIDSLIDQVEGKLPQTNINADFAALQEMDDDEIDEFIDRAAADTSCRRSRHSVTTGSDQGDSSRGEPEPDNAEDAPGVPIPL